MQIEYQNSKTDYISFLNFRLRQGLRKRPAVIAILVTYFLAIVVYDKKGFHWGNLITGIFILTILCVILYLIIYLRNVISLNRSASGEESYLLRRRLTINDEGLGIEYIDANKLKLLNWKDILSVKTSEKFIYLTLANKRMFPITKANVSPNSEVDIFVNEIESNLIKLRGPIYFLQNKPLTKPPKWAYYICLIPMVGAFAGVALIANGLFKYKNKWAVIAGIGGIAFTVFIYSSLFFYTNSESNRKSFAPLFQGQLNTLMKEVEFYKIQHGSYPDSLGQLKADDKSINIYDELQSMNDKVKDTHYNYKKVGNKYYLFSSGVDGIPNTADDIYPKMSPADTSKFGLILK